MIQSGSIFRGYVLFNTGSLLLISFSYKMHILNIHAHKDVNLIITINFLFCILMIHYLTQMGGVNVCGKILLNIYGSNVKPCICMKTFTEQLMLFAVNLDRML